MNYKQFAERIETIKQNLTMAIAQKEKQSQDLIVQLNKSLFEDKDYALIFLASLEAKLQENSDEKLSHINQLKFDIEGLKQDLENEIINYRNSHVLSEDKTRLFLIKEDKLIEPRAKKKKEIQEINQKITLFDKECLQIIKENEQTLIEEEKNYRLKLQDLERKMKIEVNRIAEAILTPVLAQNQDENKKDFNEVNKQLLLEERKKGINEIAKIKLRYYNEMRQIEMAFCNYKHNSKKDQNIIREEYNQKIEELVFARKNLQNDLHKQTDMYDFDVYQNLNSLEKEYFLAEGKMRRNYNQRIEVKENEINTLKKSKSDLWQRDLISIFNYIQEADYNQITTFDKTLEEEQKLLNITINKINETLIDVIESFKNITVEIFTRFWDISTLYEKSLHSAFVILNYQSKTIEDFDYTFFLQELNQFANEYKKRQKQRYSEFLEQLDNCYKNLIRQITIIYNSVIDFANVELKNIEGYSNNLKNLVKKTQEKALYYLKAEFEKQNKLLNNEQLLQSEKRTQDQELLLQNDKKIEDDYYLKAGELNKKIDEYQNKKKKENHSFKNEHLLSLTKSKTNVQKFKNDYKKQLQEELAIITHKYDAFIKEVELERKTKIKMGQI